MRKFSYVKKNLKENNQVTETKVTEADATINEKELVEQIGSKVEESLANKLGRSVDVVVNPADKKIEIREGNVIKSYSLYIESVPKFVLTESLDGLRYSSGEAGNKEDFKTESILRIVNETMMDINIESDLNKED